MSTLNSSSSFAEVKAAYMDNASYAEDNSVTKAAAFITACRFLTLLLPGRASKGRQQEIEFTANLETIEKQMNAASVWLDSANAGASGSQFTYADLRDFRV